MGQDRRFVLGNGDMQRIRYLKVSRLLPDLAQFVAVWPELPEHIKTAVKALVCTCTDRNA